MNTISPFDIAKDTYEDADSWDLDDHVSRSAVYLTAAEQHYAAGHWAEARTAALIAKVHAELSYT